MIDLKAGRRYAKALMTLAEEGGHLQRIADDFIKVRALLDRHPEIHHLVKNSTISLAEKEDFIEKIFGDEISRLLINFVKVLIEKKRFLEIGVIQEEYHRLFEKKMGVQEVEVVTVTSLPAAIENRLKKTLEDKLKSRVRLTMKTEPGMLGGMVIRFDGKEIDMSFRSHLNQIRQKLTA